jgi:HEAT repeat protein
MAPDVAARVTSFARACRAAARSVALYPSEHPALATALGALTQAAQTATVASVLRLAVLPDSLTVDGRGMVRPDAAVTDLATLLHRQQVGQLSIHPLTDADLWQRFLILLAQPPDQTRLRGGLGKIWATEGETRIEVRALDYAEMLRTHIRGDQATWDTIVAGCLEGTALSLDDALVELLFGVLNDPSKILGVVRAVEERMPSAEAQGKSPMVVAGLLQALAQFVATSTPGQADSVMAALAEAAAQLPIETLAPIVETQKEASRSDRARFVQQLLRRISDSSVANLIAGEVRGGRGASPQLAGAFCGLAPNADRRSAILALVRNTMGQADADADPAMAKAWRQSEELLRSYSEEKFVSGAYNAELGRLSNRAVDLDRDHTDPPEQIAAWCDTVDDSNVRLMDAALLADLMSLQQDVAQWRDLAGLVLHRVNALLVVGDFPAAALLVEALRSQSDHHDNLAVRDAAKSSLHSTMTPSTMRHVASHLDTADPSVVHAASRFCLALGTSAVGALAEVLSREERSRPRKYLCDILVSFGAQGRQAVEHLRQSPNAAVRRTAVLLLREFGGKEALPLLESLLDDTEPHVQREATRAIAMLGGDAAYAILVRTLVQGTERTRSSVLGGLWTLSDEDAEQVLSHVVLETPYRGATWPVHMRVVERLGSVGGRVAVDALAAIVKRRQFWSPFKMAALHRLAVGALVRIGTSEALEVLETIASDGPSWARAAARARLDAVTLAADRKGRQA